MNDIQQIQKIILKIISKKEKNTLEITQELLDNHKIRYTDRTVRRYISDLKKDGKITTVYDGREMKKRAYIRI